MPEKMSYGLRSSPIPDIFYQSHMILQWQMSLKVMAKEVISHPQQVSIAKDMDDNYKEHC